MILNSLYGYFLFLFLHILYNYLKTRRILSIFIEYILKIFLQRDGKMGKTFLYKFSTIYIFLIASCIVPLLLFSVHSIKIESIPEMVFWIVMYVAADFKPLVRHRSGDQTNELTMSFIVLLAVIIIFGTGQALWIAIIATLITEFISKKPLKKVLFNTGQLSLSLLAAGALFHLLKMSPGNKILDIVTDMSALLLAVTAYFILNTFLVSAVISLTSGEMLFDIFFSDFKALTSYFYMSAPISTAIAMLYDSARPYIVLIMIPPILMIDQALRRYYSLQEEAQNTLKVLADIIDERDNYTFSHSVHVAAYAKRIAQHLNLHIDEVNFIETAGQVHDLGKIGIEDRILRKKSKLTEDEYSKIKQHPEIGYRLLKNLKPYKKGAEYVLYHHERFDGKGYPHGISGKSIPLGARILAVADSYDAMTTDRPYRKALSKSVAVAELQRCAGTQFDPDIVKAFIEVIENESTAGEGKVQCS